MVLWLRADASRPLRSNAAGSIFDRSPKPRSGFKRKGLRSDGAGNAALAELTIAWRNRAIEEPFRGTYALVRDIVTAHVLDPIHLKGISREIVPYAIDGRRDENGTIAQPIRVHHEGPERRLDVAKGDPSNAVSIKSSFRKTLEALESRRVTGDSA